MSITLVQSASTHGSGAQNLFFGADNTAGNAIIVLGCFAGVTGVNSIIDDAGNSYSHLASFLNGNGALEAQLFYAFNIAGPLSGAFNSVTFTPGTPGVDTGIAIHEFSGINSFDVESHNSGSGASQTSNSATTNFADELLFGFTATILSGASPSATPGTGYTAVRTVAQNGSTLVSFITEYQIVSATGSFAATTSASAGKGGSSNWATQLATFYLSAADPYAPARMFAMF
jgi:hypothetical protein